MNASEIVRRAWRELPQADRNLLESIRAHQWEVCEQPLGLYADALLRSADRGKLPGAEVRRADAALGLWIPQLRVMLINASHPALSGLDAPTFEWALARIAWHEWAHALSIDRASEEDVRAGAQYLDRVPEPIAKLIREAGYRRSEYTHEIVAEIYSMLMFRRRAGETGKPAWLDQGVYELVRGVAGWNQ